MKVYIKSIKDFSFLTVFDAVDYELKDGDDSTATVYSDGHDTFVGHWAYINGDLFFIASATPKDDKLKFKLKHPSNAFGRLLPYSGQTTFGELIAAGLTNGFKSVSDEFYRMPYLTITNADYTAYTADVDDYGYYSVSETIQDARKNGVCVDFGISGATSQSLTVNIYTADFSTAVFTFNDGHNELISEEYDNAKTSKATVVQLQEDGTKTTTDYYLSADHHISTTVPASRLEGAWKVYNATADESPLAVATGAFSGNAEAHKIEFYSDKLLQYGQPVKVRLRNAPFEGVISCRAVSSKNGRYRYKIGDLKNTVTEKIQSISSTQYVRSVNGHTGDAVLTASDIGAVSSARSDLVTVTPTNTTTTAGSTTNKISYYKNGNTVTMTFDFILASTTAQATVCTLPEAYRPPSALTTIVPQYGSNGNANRYIIIQANGIVGAFSGTQTRLMGVITYAI